jgi:RNA polymerase subunit RPABC4/transcription elongation factor Spt4
MEPIINFNSLSDFFVYLSAFFGAFLAALWLSLVFWTNRDIQSRTRERFTPALATIFVAILNLPGLLIYLILRPKKTLTEIYQQTLEEEALLTEIELKANCPGCGSQTDPDWQLCPHCHTRLHKPCTNCGRLMELPWHICPYCSHEVPGARRTSTQSRILTDGPEVVDIQEPES